MKPQWSVTMNPETDMRTHVIMSRALVAKIDRLVGARRRSRFISDAVARELAHRELVAAADAAIGSGVGQDRPWGNTPESIAAWVHDGRQASLAGDDALDALRARVASERT